MKAVRPIIVSWGSLTPNDVGRRKGGKGRKEKKKKDWDVPDYKLACFP